MRRKDQLGVELERQNASDYELTREDESGADGDDLVEFNVMPPPVMEGRGKPLSSLEKAYMPASDPEQDYQVEQMMEKHNSLGEQTTRKSEMDEIQALRELQEENPDEVSNQPAAAHLPPSSLPPNSPQQMPSTRPKPPDPRTQPPQVPGAATPPQPRNPFANYHQEQPQPESGLPWKPAGPPGAFGKSLRKHDCLTVHGYQKHEEWEAEQGKKFFRTHKTAFRRT